ncbi:MAG TPA: hypothetical protein VHY20_02575, partial [Pirellulales bacterium]|nr:hypothetical protein [Pirellulales bacterium]
SHGTVSLTDASNAISLFAAKTDGGAVNLAGTGSLTIGTVSGLSGVDTSDGGSMPAGADAVFDLLGSITVAKSVAAALLSLTAPTVNFDVALSPAALGVQGNSVFDGGSVATTGSQTYSGSVTLEQSTTLSSRVGPLNVMGTIDGAFNLIADSDGVITFGGAVGGFVPLASLTGQGKSNPAAGLTQLDASVTTAGSQFYNNPLLLAGNPALDSSAGNITFGSTVGGNSALSTSAPGTTTFDGLVSIASLTAAGTVVQIINGPINTVNSQEYDAHVLVQNNPSLFASQGNITFDSTVGGNSALSTSAPGTTTFDGLVSIASLTVGPSAGYGIAQINAGPINTVGSQIYNAILLLANNPALTSSQGNITFNSTVGGNSALTTASPGTTTFNALVSIASLSTSNFSGFGTTNIDTASINTVGGQTYNAPVLLGGEDPTLASANGNITFNSTVGGNAALVINNPGTTIFNALVSIASIQVNGPAGAVKINGGMMMTTGAQTYQNQVALSGSTSLISSAGGNIEFDMRVTNSTSNRLDLTVQTTGKHIYRHGVESAIHVINKS